MLLREPILPVRLVASPLRRPPEALTPLLRPPAREGMLLGRFMSTRLRPLRLLAKPARLPLVLMPPLPMLW